MVRLLLGVLLAVLAVMVSTPAVLADGWPSCC